MLLSSIRQASGIDDDEEEDGEDNKPERALRNILVTDIDVVVKAKPVATILTSLIKSSVKRRELLLEMLFMLLDAPEHEEQILEIVEASGGIRILSITLPLIEWKDENKFRVSQLLRKIMNTSKSEHDDATRGAVVSALSNLLSPMCSNELIKDEAAVAAITLCARSTYHESLASVVLPRLLHRLVTSGSKDDDEESNSNEVTLLKICSILRQQKRLHKDEIESVVRVFVLLLLLCLCLSLSTLTLTLTL